MSSPDTLNNLIADLFSRLMTILHLAFILACFLGYGYAIDKVDGLGLDVITVRWWLGGLVLTYIIITGLLSITVAVYEHITAIYGQVSSMNKHLEEISSKIR